MSPQFIDDFALYLMNVMLRSRETARWLLSRPSRVVQQLYTCLCNVIEQTIRSKIVSIRNVWAGGWSVACPSTMTWASCFCFKEGVHDVQAVCKIDMQEIPALLVLCGEAMWSKCSAKFSGLRAAKCPYIQVDIDDYFQFCRRSTK